MATSLKFYLKKDYNQLRNRIIAQNTITFTFCDYTPAEGEDIFFAIKEQNDIDEDEIYVKMRKKENNQFVVDLPCNKLITYEFRIFTKMTDSDIILEQSAINTFRYEGIIFDERKIEETEQWGTIQLTLHRLNQTEEELHNVIYKRIEESDLAQEVADFINNNQAQVDNIQADVRTVISQLSTILDDFIDEGDE